MPKLLSKGAEAEIIYTGRFVIKHRVSKGYRHPVLDKKIIKSRTKKESKLLIKASEIINAPKPFFIPECDFTRIKMPFIDGDRLSDVLNKYPKEKQSGIMRELGRQVALLHANNIIHGDLTTSNVILSNNKLLVRKRAKRDRAKPVSSKCSPKGKACLFIIDFGLGYISAKIEDKAVDLHLIKQALEAKHFQNWENLFREFLKGYKYLESDRVMARLTIVEKRGRYKH